MVHATDSDRIIPLRGSAAADITDVILLHILLVSVVIGRGYSMVFKIVDPC
jgi:hypothetical protein